MLIKEEDLVHFGIIRRSGRYPWGSGKYENTHNRNLLNYIDELKSKGWADKDIAKGLEMSLGEYRAERSNARQQQKAANVAMAQRLHDKGYSNVEGAKRMGIPEPTYRTYLKPGAADRNTKLRATAETLKNEVDDKKWLDIGKGNEYYLGVTSTVLTNAINLVKSWGYEVHEVPILQQGTGLKTKTKVLALPGTTQKDAWMARDDIKTIKSFSNDNGKTYNKIQPPLPIHPKRVEVVYREDGGGKSDGVIYVRPGVKDISLGDSSYAQVRIKVGDKHYLKGMALYKDDLPDGVDLQFHTSKSKHDVPDKLDAMKLVSDDPVYPFGTVTRQIFDKSGPDAKVTSVMNLVNEEGNWEKWSKTLSSQMLSKQSPALAKTQLDMTYEQRLDNFEDLMKLTNPTVKRKLLLDYADTLDSASTHLKAASMPGQSVKVILPISNIKPGEVFAPTYRDGTPVVLIRHPHGGTFEIPELTVNNRNAEGRKLLGANATAAIGIHHTVAQRLSGADFDGDTVLVIPNPQKQIKTTPALEGLKGFDPSAAYPGYPGMKPMEGKYKQTEMGKISNLITDMSIRNAPSDEIARAVKHSMVVIDAEKGLNHKLSRSDNNIKELTDKYQPKIEGKAGASTLISRSRSPFDIPQRREGRVSEGGPISKETGERIWIPTGKVGKDGKPLTIKVKRLSVTPDAFTLSSGTPIEAHYATYSNKLKALANRARKEAVNTPRSDWSTSAKKTYATQVASLDSKLAIAKQNAPRERQAQTLANTNIKIRRDYNPNLTKDQIKKIRFQALEEARTRMGAHKDKIDIEPDEWDAIQAGALSDSKVNEILTHADMKKVRQLALPKPEILMSPTKTTRAQAMLASGFTRIEVADALGVSLTTLDTATK